MSDIARKAKAFAILAGLVALTFSPAYLPIEWVRTAAPYVIGIAGGLVLYVGYLIIYEVLGDFGHE